MASYWDIFVWFVVGIATVAFIYFIEDCLGPKPNRPPERSKCSRSCPPSGESSEPQTRSKLRRTPVGILSTEELSVYNGENGRRILISVCGRIFDMTSGHNFYGPGAAYHAFAGKDATFLLGAMATDPERCNKRNFGQWDSQWVREYTQIHPDVAIPYCEDKEFSEETLEGWLRSFIVKYPVVGKLRGFMDVCEESWNRVVNADLAPGHATQSNAPLAQFEHLPLLPLKELDSSKHVSIGGFVMDVGICNFIYGPVTADFSEALGHDISVAIIKDEFTAQALDQPVACLDSNQQDQLETLILKFRETYPTVGALNDASKYRPLKEQVMSSTKQPTIAQSPSTDQITEEEKITDTQTCAQPEPSKQEEKEDGIEKIKEKEDDKENDNDWDIVQHSDANSPVVEQRKNSKTINHGIQGKTK